MKTLLALLLLIPSLSWSARGATYSPGGITGAIGVILGFFFVYIMIAEQIAINKDRNKNLKNTKKISVKSIKQEKERNIMKFSNGDKYIGQIKNGEMHGDGTYIFSDGDKYIGKHQKGKFSGFGEMSYKSGMIEKGTFKNDDLNGKGTIIWPDGSIYIGDFKDGNRTGKGKYTWPTGTKYEGEFKKGLKDGFGIQTYEDGSVVKGVWRKNKLIKPHK